MKSWKEIPIGGVVTEPGSSVEYETGTWRSFRPVVDQEKCTRCMFCWVYCPDGIVRLKDEKIEIDLKYCKGCGICAEECPRKAIEMVEEFKFR